MLILYRVNGVKKAILLDTFYHCFIINKIPDFVFLPVGAVDVAALAACIDCGEVAIRR